MLHLKLVLLHLLHDAPEWFDLQDIENLGFMISTEWARIISMQPLIDTLFAERAFTYSAVIFD